MDKRIGAQYYTIRDFCKTIEDFDSSCKRVKEIGYKAVQLSGIPNFDPHAIREILDKHGLTPFCTHRSWQDYLENIDAEINFHKVVGCDIAGLGALPGAFSEGGMEPEALKKFAKDATVVANKLAEHGITFGYHNHAFEFRKFDGKFAFDILTESVKSDNFKYILDTYWLAYAGIDPARFILERAGQVVCVHLKDLKIVGNDPRYAEVGCGNILWDEVLPACEKAGVKYALVEQDECDVNPFDALTTSYNYLTTKGFN